MNPLDEKERVRYYTDIIAATLERTTRRIIVLCVVIAVAFSAAVIYLENSHKKEREELVSALNAQNEQWIQAWKEYDFESYEVSTEGGGNANFIGNDGDIYNGESARPSTD